MSIIVDTETKLVVSGLTGREGSFHGLRNRDYGTDLVAGVTPGKGGQDVDGVPVFDAIEEAVAERGANTSMIFVPARFAAAAIEEAIEAGIGTVIAITEGIPVFDMLRVYWRAREAGVRLIGPNCPGVLSPGKANVGIIPAQFFDAGPIGVVSKSGTLTYQIGNELKQAGIGNSSIVGIGGDPIIGSDFIDVLTLFEQDPETELIVIVGEIGGDAEERAAEFIAESVEQAGGRLHRRLHRPAGQADGSRRGDHLRLLGHRGGEEGRARGEGRARRQEPDRDRRARGRGDQSARLTVAKVGPMAADLISFARGAPSADILPAEAVRGAATTALAEDWERALSYGTGIGHPGLCEWIATELHGIDADRVMVTNGSMEAAALLFRYMLEPGDRVIVEQPSYDRTLLLLGRSGAEIVGVPLEADGIDIDALERELAAGPVQLAHVIPNFHNPAGCTLSEHKRERLVELAAEHGFTLFEDDPYRLISFGAAELPTMLSLDRSRAGDPRIFVLEDGQPRGPGRLSGRPGGADRDARQARRRALHLAQHARRVGRAGAVPLGRAGRQHQLRQRRPSPSAATRSSRRLAPSFPRPASSSPRAVTSSGSISLRARHSGGAARSPSATAPPSSPAPTSCSRAGSRACGSRSPASRPSGSTRGWPGSRPRSSRLASPARPEGLNRSAVGDLRQC